jgi:predicted YcjX-like family ATPase
MAALSEDGDYFEAIDDGKRSIQGFDELIAQIKDLVAAQRANAGADMMRSEAQSELTALMQKLMSRPVAETDMSVLAEALTEISAMRTDHKAYKFTVERDNQGFMQQIIAVPITPTQH